MDGIMFPWSATYKPKWSWEAFNCFKKAPSESSEAPWFFLYICLCSFFRMFLACLSLVYHVFYRVTLSFAMILSLETQLYTPLFLLINQLLTSAFARRKLEDLQSRQWLGRTARTSMVFWVPLIWKLGPSGTKYWLVVWNIFHIFRFHNIWDNPSHWLIFFKMVKTTNQNMCSQIFPEKLRDTGIPVYPLYWDMIGSFKAKFRGTKGGPRFSIWVSHLCRSWMMSGQHYGSWQAWLITTCSGRCLALSDCSKLACIYGECPFGVQISPGQYGTILNMAVPSISPQNILRSNMLEPPTRNARVQLDCVDYTQSISSSSRASAWSLALHFFQCMRASAIRCWMMKFRCAFNISLNSCEKHTPSLKTFCRSW